MLIPADGERTPHHGKIAAASVIGVLPVFAAAVFFQHWLVGGLRAAPCAEVVVRRHAATKAA